MESARLSTARATIVANAIRNDGTFCGTDEWLESHNVTRDEYLTFIEYGQRLAGMYEWREGHADMPPVVECDAVIGKASATKKGVTLTVDVTPAALPSIQPLIDEPVVVQMYPMQMPLPTDDAEYVMVDSDGAIVD